MEPVGLFDPLGALYDLSDPSGAQIVFHGDLAIGDALAPHREHRGFAILPRLTLFLTPGLGELARHFLVLGLEKLDFALELLDPPLHRGNHFTDLHSRRPSGFLRWSIHVRFSIAHAFVCNAAARRRWPSVHSTVSAFSIRCSASTCSPIESHVRGDRFNDSRVTRWTGLIPCPCPRGTVPRRRRTRPRRSPPSPRPRGAAVARPPCKPRGNSIPTGQ